MSKKSRTQLLAIAVLAALAISLGVTVHGVYADGDGDKNKEMDQALPLPEKTGLKYPNLGSHLDQLVTSVEEGETTAEDAAGETAVHREESVAVTIYLSGSVEDVVSFLEENGGDPRNVGEDYIEAYVPVTLLGQLSEQPGVIRVREIIPPADDYGPISSQGIQAHGSAVWNQAGLSGQGIKVGVIDSDFGFRGYRELIGSEVPTPAGVRCYPDVGQPQANLADCAHPDMGSVHGTAVAEALMDIAPEVDLYITSPSSKGDVLDAVDWMVSQGVSVIVHSESYVFDGPGDGTSPFSDSPLRAVDRAVAGGVVWVNSAGNSALDTWFARAPFRDSDGDGFIEFVVGDEVNDIILEAGDWIRVQLRWEDSWEGASTDLDLRIQDTRQVLAVSVDPQSGAADHIPREVIAGDVPRSGEYGIIVQHVSGSAPDWIQLMVSGVGSIQRYTKSGSITNPAESAKPGMLAVGATHYYDTNTIASYSSRGPTPDGRPKPDIVGTACGETASYEPESPEFHDGNYCWFPGTSQAAPHVAGLAALVRQRFPDYTPAQVASYLKDNAEQRETPDPNNTWGHGFAQLPTLPGGCEVFDPGLASDCNTLLAARDMLAGSATLNWSAGADISSWDGVDLGGSPPRVTTLDLRERQLDGTIAPGLGSLTKLEILNLRSNQLTGPIPTELGNLTNLTELWLYENQLTGTIPTELGSLTNLTHLYLSSNQLTGTIPTELGSLTNLTYLSLHSNQLSGEIPTGLGNLTNLEQLWLYDNQLTGTIPSELGNLTNLAKLVLWGNQLTGEIPTWLSSLTDLTVLSLSRNQLTGEIPSGLGNLANLEELYLNENQLTGTIPPELGNLTNLERLDLHNNQLTGPIPTELGNLTNLTHLYLSSNQLTGTIPTELGSLTNLTYLSLHSNQLSGEIPTGLGNLTNLEQLWLYDNQLTGTIPSELGNLTNLAKLVLWGNQLTGEIPTWLGSLTDLTVLSLSRNQLTGEIPSELGNLANLEELYLNENQLTGTIPPELGNLTNLERLDLHNNQLTGEIPSRLASITKLQRLSLSNNQLTGPVPTWLSSLADLERLSLWGNQLTGEIPTQLGSLANLEELYLNENQLTGTIPPELGNLTNLERLDLHNNALTGEIPSRLASITKLKRLSLSDNQLTGPVPTWLGGLNDLELLYLGDNRLTGEIPAQLGRLAKLQRLSLRINQLTGEIPPELGNLTNLELLNLRNNQLTGELPDSLTRITALTGFFFYNNPGLCAPVDNTFQEWLDGIANTIGSSCAPADSPEDRVVLVELHQAAGGVDWENSANWLSDRPVREWHGVTTDANGRVTNLLLGGNQLSGEIPAELGSLAMLERLWLHDNQLSGEIPPELGNLANLERLYLFDNQLSGEMPPELGNLTNLEWLYLDRNRLTGEIPPELGSLAGLERLRLSNNQLTGEIPSELGHLANLTVLHLSGNRLTGCVPAGLRDVEDNDFARLGLPFCTPGDPLVARYDTNGTPGIQKDEVITAINDYLFGTGDDTPAPTKAQVIRLINLYLFGPDA